MADRIFSYLDRSIDELNELKNEYTNLIQQNPPPWSNIIKVSFRTQLKLLQESISYWDECITKLENKANHMRNDDTEKQPLLERIDEHNNDAGHRLLKREVSKMLLDGQGYLNLEPPSIKTTSDIPTATPTLSTQIVNIQKFDGDILKWRSFKQRFDHSIHHKSYPNIEKMIALLGLLEGDALAEVQGFEVSNENYNSVYNALEERFGNDQVLIHQLQSKLRSIPPAKEDAKSIRDTVNAVTNMVRQLQNLNVHTDNKATILDVIEKMPEKERIELRYFSMSSQNATLDQIIKKMKDMTFKAEIAADDKRENSSRKSNVSPSNPQFMPTFVSEKQVQCSQFTNTNTFPQYQNKYTDNQSSSRKFVCSFCDKDHASYNCPQYVSSDERIQQLQAKDCCTKCTKQNHKANECQSNVTCRICQGHHYSFLCKQCNNSNYQEQSNTNSFVSLGKQQGCLLTKRVTVSNPFTKETVDATVLFDAGSQRSFVSDRLIRQLKLPREAREQLQLQGIGAKATNYVSSKVKLGIKTTTNVEEICANSIGRIANSVSLIHFEEDKLASTTVTETTPDILIGMDYFFSFITSFEKRNDMVIVHSKVGQILSGKIETAQTEIISTLAIETRTPHYWKYKAMGYKRKEPDTQDKQSFKMLKKINFNETKNISKVENPPRNTEKAKPQPSMQQLQKLKQYYRPRIFYNQKTPPPFKLKPVEKLFLFPHGGTKPKLEIVQRNVKREPGTSKFAASGERLSETVTTTPQIKALKEKSSVELQLYKILTNQYGSKTFQRSPQRSVDLDSND